MTSRAVPILLFLAALIAAPWTAHADYAPPSPWPYAKGTSTPQVGVLIRSVGSTLSGSIAWNASGGTAYWECFDATSQPLTGTAPVWQSVSCATNSFCSAATVPAGGIKFTTGIYCGFSSTGPTYTQAAGASAGFYSVAYR